MSRYILDLHAGVDLVVGSLTGGEERDLLATFDVGLNESAERLLDQPVLDHPAPEQVRVVIRTLAELGLPDGGTLPEVFAAVERAGLRPCPLATGPALRLSWLGQPNAPDSVLSNGRAPSASVTVLSEPLDDTFDTPKGFYLRVVDGRPWLRGYRCDDTHVHAPDTVFALRADA